jgi:hypothetical protein
MRVVAENSFFMLVLVGCWRKVIWVSYWFIFNLASRFCFLGWKKAWRLFSAGSRLFPVGLGHCYGGRLVHLPYVGVWESLFDFMSQLLYVNLAIRLNVHHRMLALVMANLQRIARANLDFGRLKLKNVLLVDLRGTLRFALSLLIKQSDHELGK